MFLDMEADNDTVLKFLWLVPSSFHENLRKGTIISKP